MEFDDIVWVNKIGVMKKCRRTGISWSSRAGSLWWCSLFVVEKTPPLTAKITLPHMWKNHFIYIYIYIYDFSTCVVTATCWAIYYQLWWCISVGPRLRKTKVFADFFFFIIKWYHIINKFQTKLGCKINKYTHTKFN
jgi:hypothetical protein